MAQAPEAELQLGDLLPLEKQILVQYKTLALKLNALSDEIAKLNKSLPASSQIDVDPALGAADGLLTNMRSLERKIGLVYTMFRTAVYSLLLQNQESEERSQSHDAEVLVSDDATE